MKIKFIRLRHHHPNEVNRIPGILFFKTSRACSEPGQLESPRYTNRPSSLHSILANNNLQGNSSLNGTTEIVPNVTKSSYVNSNLYNSNGTITVEQLHKDFQKMKVSLDEMKIKFTDQIRDLVDELDEEKKARATLQIELERLQKQIQKSSLVN